MVSGQVFLAGSLSLNTTGRESESPDQLYRWYSLTLSPRIGYYLTDKLAVGSGIDLYSSRSISEYTLDRTTLKNKSIGLSPFARFFPVSIDRLSFYLEIQPEVYIGWGTRESESGTIVQTDKTRNFGFGMALRPGAEYSLTDRIRIGISAGYLEYSWERMTYDPGEDETVDIEGHTSLYFNNLGLSLIWLLQN